MALLLGKEECDRVLFGALSTQILATAASKLRPALAVVTHRDGRRHVERADRVPIARPRPQAPAAAGRGQQGAGRVDELGLMALCFRVDEGGLSDGWWVRMLFALSPAKKSRVMSL